MLGIGKSKERETHLFTVLEKCGPLGFQIKDSLYCLSLPVHGKRL
jgi:hypothetical protein